MNTTITMRWFRILIILLLLFRVAQVQVAKSAARYEAKLLASGAQVTIPPPKPTPPPIPSVPSILARIGWCESGNKQFEADGSVRRGRANPRDVGKYQINETYHLATAKRMGYDIYTELGNTLYALHLYNTQGTMPWNWSRHCWEK